MTYSYGLYGEKPLRGMAVWVVTLYRDSKPVRSWLRFTLNSARNKGALEARKAERKDQR